MPIKLPAQRRSLPLSSRYAKIYAAVAQIPRGYVSTYGHVASAAGFPGAARQVGYALYALPFDSPIPWHRVINAHGKISLPAESSSATRQKRLLRSEGIRLSSQGRIDLQRYGWFF